MTTGPHLSFIIPAFNEVASLPSVLASISVHVPPGVPFETIVADHGSSDGTVAAAMAAGARVLVTLRNFGRRHASGRVLVFLDADVSLTPRWRERIGDVLGQLEDCPVLTGSWCGVSAHPSWIERYWFEPLLHGNNSHINSGHLIVAAADFDRLGGFDEALETGEDYEFSMRAKAAGMSVVDDPALAVIHDGYPKTLPEFFRRERWHGRGDADTLKAGSPSRVVIVTALFWLLQAAAAVSLLFLQGRLAALLLALALSLCVAAAAVKYGVRRPVVLVVNSVLYYVYFLARGIALVSALRAPRPVKHRRAT
jgi:glycosyltransferase involved in cell wall biosynthesis